MYKLDKDEYIVYSQKKSWWTKIICTLYFVGCLYLALLITFKPIPDTDLKFVRCLLDLIFLPLSYSALQWLICDVIMTNKRILYKNIFFQTRFIDLKKIIYVAIWYNPTPITGLDDLYIKITNKLLRIRIRVPDDIKFRNKILEFIQSSIPDNNLNQDLLKKTLFYKLGVYYEPQQ